MRRILLSLFNRGCSGRSRSPPDQVPRSPNPAPFLSLHRFACGVFVLRRDGGAARLSIDINH